MQGCQHFHQVPVIEIQHAQIWLQSVELGHPLPLLLYQEPFELHSCRWSSHNVTSDAMKIPFSRFSRRLASASLLNISFKFCRCSASFLPDTRTSSTQTTVCIWDALQPILHHSLENFWGRRNTVWQSVICKQTIMRVYYKVLLGLLIQ